MTVYYPQEGQVNRTEMYVNGMSLHYGSGTTVLVANGQCRDSTNKNDIFINTGASTPVAGEPVEQFYTTVNLSATGVGKLNGTQENYSASASVPYTGILHVYAIGCSTSLPPIQSETIRKSVNADGVIATSLNPVTPLPLPPGFYVSQYNSLSVSQNPLLASGYDSFRRVGSIRLIAGVLQPFHQDDQQNSTNRTMWLDTPLAFGSDGDFTAAEYAALPAADWTAPVGGTSHTISLLGYIPAQAITVIMGAQFLSDAGAAVNVALVTGVSGLSAATFPYSFVNIVGGVASTRYFGMLNIPIDLAAPVNGLQSPNVKVLVASDAVAPSTVKLRILGYVDNI